MCYVGIDISKYKHNCFILDQSGETIIKDFVFANNLEGFNSLKTLLCIIQCGWRTYTYCNTEVFYLKLS